LNLIRLSLKGEILLACPYFLHRLFLNWLLPTAYCLLSPFPYRPLRGKSEIKWCPSGELTPSADEIAIPGLLFSYFRYKRILSPVGACPRTPGEHKVHPYLRPETFVGANNYSPLPSPISRISMIFAILGQAPRKIFFSGRKKIISGRKLKSG
jgi:hypothetical protein